MASAGATLYSLLQRSSSYPAMSMATTGSKHPATQGREPVAIDLALQGGGSHGAFTWGVLDRLLEEPWLQIDGISGTSAGAMNAAVMVAGHAAGGAPARARRARGLLAPGVRGGAATARSGAARSTCCSAAGRSTTRPCTSPWTSPRGCSRPTTSTRAASTRCARSWPRASTSTQLARAPIKLFITATNVHTGRGRVFRNAEVTPDVMLASACLPTMFQAVEIDGEPYWDGGYAGNPTLTPLVRECDASDTILVPINPVERPGTPRSAREILNRLNEISFNSATIKELRMIALLQQVGRSRQRRGCGLGQHAHPP